MSIGPSHDVIICVHNGDDDVKCCLKSLSGHWEGPDKLIIVNDCSNSALSRFLREFSAKEDRVTLIELTERHYYTRAANVGLLESRAEIRTLLNSDTVVTCDWKSEIARVFRKYPNVGIVGPLSNAASTQSVPFVKSTLGQTAINTIPRGVSVEEFAEFVRNASRGIPIPFVPLVHGFCFSVSRGVVESLGGFDEASFPKGYGEENDYCFRAEDAGIILAVATGAFVYHAKSKSYSADERKVLMDAGMNMLVCKYGVARIQRAVAYMEMNPFLVRIRSAVLEQWQDHYRQNDATRP